MSSKINICAQPACKKETCKTDPPKAETCPPGETETADVEDVSSSSTKDARIIIIGAGMAGLAAAHSLQQAGIHNFVILEALDRYESLTLFPLGKLSSHITYTNCNNLVRYFHEKIAYYINGVLKTVSRKAKLSFRKW